MRPVLSRATSAGSLPGKGCGKLAGTPLWEGSEVPKSRFPLLTGLSPVTDCVAVKYKTKRQEFQLGFYPKPKDAWMAESFAYAEMPVRGLDLPAGGK